MRGDQRAFTMLVTRHKAALYRYIRAYVGDADDAYDLLQQTFIAAWRALGRYDKERPLGTWLRAIARNKCRDHVRKARITRVLMIADWGSSAERVADPRPTPEDNSIDEEAVRALGRAVAELPRALKEPLLLTTLEKLSQAEAGRQLGISAKAVETRIYRARRRLAEIIVSSAGDQT